MVKPLLVAFACVGVVGCGGGQVSSERGFRESSATMPAELQSLAGKRMFFGHQSVGMDILAGVEDLMKRAPIAAGIRIAHSSDADALVPGVLAHEAVGTNGDPMSKIRAFQTFMDSGIGNKADVALFKFCYIDFEESTDARQVFREYKATMDALKARYPSTTFVHVTMPLRMVQAGPKALIKRIIGRPPGGYAQNARRNAYNSLLRREYAGREPLFDLAEVESTRPDGSRVTFELDGQELFALNPPYTPDNGHLNEAGRIRAAEAFVRVLAAAGR